MQMATGALAPLRKFFMKDVEKEQIESEAKLAEFLEHLEYEEQTDILEKDESLAKQLAKEENKETKKQHRISHRKERKRALKLQ